MLYRLLVLCTLLVGSIVGEKQPSTHATEGAFRTFHEQALSSAAPIQLDDASFGAFTALPRNHSSAVLLTALAPQFGCQLCRDFQPEWELLTRSWLRGDPKGRAGLLFGTLDFLDGRQTFQSVSGAPMISSDQSTDMIHSWVFRLLLS